MLSSTNKTSHFCFDKKLPGVNCVVVVHEQVFMSPKPTFSVVHFNEPSWKTGNDEPRSDGFLVENPKELSLVVR